MPQAICSLSQWLSGKESSCDAGDKGCQVQSLGQKDPLKEGIATHFSIFAWDITCTEKPGGLQSMGLQKRHGLVTKQQYVGSESH